MLNQYNQKQLKIQKILAFYHQDIAFKIIFPNFQ